MRAMLGESCRVDLGSFQVILLTIVCFVYLFGLLFVLFVYLFFFFNDTATTEIYTLFPTRRSSDLSDGFKTYQEGLNNETFNFLIDCIKTLNVEIANDSSLGRGFCIGHSYFCGQAECTEEWLKRVVYFEIIPMLREYWFDEPKKLVTWKKTLSGIFND